MQNKIFYSLILFPMLMLSSKIGFAQTSDDPNSLMRSNGKIYVVAAICVTILAGLFLYVLSIDKKITRVERDSTNGENI